jgi:acetyl esterase/lipase
LSADDRPAEFQYETLRDIEYGDVAGTKLLLDAYVPKGDGPFPAVLVVHGGAWASGSKSQLSFYAKGLVKRGFVCFAINYRLAPKHRFPAQIEDCRTALNWIRTKGKSNYKVNTAPVGAIGYSAGGHLVALLGTTGKRPEKDTDIDTRLQAVCAGGAPCDFRNMTPSSRKLAFWLGGTRANKPDTYITASPLNFVTKDDCPMYFFNGRKDTLVEPKTAQAMHEALKKVSVDTKIHIVESGSHLSTAIDRTAVSGAIEFLTKHLKK